MTYRHSWSLFAEGQRKLLPLLQCRYGRRCHTRIEVKVRTQAGLWRAVEWHSTPVGEK